MELKRQEQRVRGLQKQLSAREEEKRVLCENVEDAETALRTAAHDREALAAYTINIGRALDKVRLGLTWF